MIVTSDEGVPLAATFSVEGGLTGFSLVLESQGGITGSSSARNSNYATGLRLLLARCGAHKIEILDALVDSSATQHLSEAERRLVVPSMPFPIRVENPTRLQRALCKAQATVGRRPGAKGGGNQRKRVRLMLGLPNGMRVSAGQLEAMLAGPGPGHWAFLANPRVYDIEAAVRHDRTDNWVTAGRPIAVGDRIIVWKARGRERRRGVVAVGEVVIGARIIADHDNPFWRRGSEHATAQERIGIKYNSVGFPRWLDEHPELGKLAVARAKGGTVFRLRPDEFESICKLAETLGRPYQHANASVVVRSGAPHAVDQNVTERGWRAHARTQNLLAEFLKEKGLAPKSPVGDPEYDLYWCVGEEGWVAEVKSTVDGNEEKQLRLGLGQVLRYREILRARYGPKINAVLVVERAPADSTWIATCRSVGVTITWPARFHELVSRSVPSSF